MNKYDLSLNSKQININLSRYLQGAYTVKLIVNGKVVDAKTIIKQ